MTLIRYFVKENTLSGLQNRGMDHCVSCEEKIVIWDEVTSKRSGNNLRLRCLPCSKRYRLI